MPYVHVETDVYLSPEECGTAVSKGDMDVLLRFVKAARGAVDLLFDAGHHAEARELFETGSPIITMFDLGIKLWAPLSIDEKYQRWLTERAAGMAL